MERLKWSRARLLMSKPTPSDILPPSRMYHLKPPPNGATNGGPSIQMPEAVKDICLKWVTQRQQHLQIPHLSMGDDSGKLCPWHSLLDLHAGLQVRFSSLPSNYYCLCNIGGWAL